MKERGSIRCTGVVVSALVVLSVHQVEHERCDEGKRNYS